MAIIKKITVATVCGDSAPAKVKRDDRPKTGDKKELLQVFGQARRMLTGETDKGPFIKFKGSFEAIDIETGNVVKSTNMILPDVAADLIEEGLSIQNANSVDFAMTIGYEGDETNVGYHYYAVPLLAAEETDPLAQIRAKLIDQKALPNPDAETDAKADAEATGDDNPPPKGNGKTTRGKRGTRTQASA